MMIFTEVSRTLKNEHSKRAYDPSQSIPVTRSSMPPLDEYVAEIAPLWESRWLTNNGAKHRELEAALRERLGVENLVLFTNGHNALECILEALQLGADGRREVVTTPFTFASTTHAIVRKGLTPVFADVRPSDLTLDPADVERRITPATCAIVPVHVYGNLCDVDAFADIAARHGLALIYDAAHAFGVERDGVSAAAFGDAAMFSFHATKAFNTVEGGAVAFRDPALYDALNHWKNFGITGQESVEYVGGNAKMNELCAAMGLCNLRHFDEEVAKRARVEERYRERLGDVEGLRLIEPQAGVKPNHAYMPVLFEDGFGATRDEVFAALAAQGVAARKYFYPPVSDYECYRGRFDSADTPVARDAAARVLCLPMYADLAPKDVDRVCDVVVGCGKGVR